MATKKTTTSKSVKKEENSVNTTKKNSQKTSPTKKAKSVATATTKTKAVAAKSTEAKKPAVVTKSQTVVVAKVDVGFGNSLYIRGQGAGLSWEKGILMENIGPDEWRWVTNKAASDGIIFKLLINDSTWACGDDFVVTIGSTSITRPEFW